MKESYSKVLKINARQMLVDWRVRIMPLDEFGAAINYLMSIKNEGGSLEKSFFEPDAVSRTLHINAEDADRISDSLKKCVLFKAVGDNYEIDYDGGLVQKPRDTLIHKSDCY